MPRGIETDVSGCVSEGEAFTDSGKYPSDHCMRVQAQEMKDVNKNECE